jgi:hypothetical protein
LRAIGQQSIEHCRELSGERFSIELAQHAHGGVARRKRAGLSPAVGGNDGSIKGVLIARVHRPASTCGRQRLAGGTRPHQRQYRSLCSQVLE